MAAILFRHQCVKCQVKNELRVHGPYIEPSSFDTHYEHHELLIHS